MSRQNETADQVKAFRAWANTLPDPELLEALADSIARRVAELLLADHTPIAPLIDAAEVARRHGVTRSFVYDNAARLGAIRLGDGSRARLRFNPETVASALTAPTTPPVRAFCMHTV